MEMNEYQRYASTTAIYPGHDDPTDANGLSYVTMGLVGEAGEIANKVKKILRDQNGAITFANAMDLQKEIGDVLWYVSQMCQQLDIFLDDVAQKNLNKLLDRKDRGVLGGSGDNR